MIALSTVRRWAGSFLDRHYPSGLIRYRLYARSRHLEPELWLVPKLVGRDDVAVDIGANMGVWCLQMERFAGRVHCFEPNPSCIRALERILPRRVSLHRVALSDRCGNARLRFDPGNTGIGTIEGRNTLTGNAGIKRIETLTVTTARLDDFALDHVSLVKIDVEGHEEAVLAGAIETLARSRPAVICEIEERHNPGGLARIREFFADRGYRAGALYNGRLRDLAEIEGEGRIALGDAGGINNFIFVDRSQADPLAT